MKYFAILLTVVFLFSCSAKEASDNKPVENMVNTENTDGIPQSAVDFIKSEFPKAEDLEWEKEGNGYEAEFKISGVEYSVEFDQEGNWLATEKEINADDVPESVMNVVEDKYPDHKVEEVEYIITAEKNNLYEFELESGDKELEVLIKDDGTIISQEEEKDNDENEEVDD